jgi:hypothetical protein
VQTTSDFTDFYGWEDELIIDLGGGASVVYTQDDLGTVTVQMSGQTLSASQFGGVLGSSIGRILGRELGDNPFVTAGASTLLGAIGRSLGSAMESAGFFTPVTSSLSINFGGDGPLLGFAVNEAAQTVAPGFTGNLMTVGLGQLGSLLFGALAEEIGLDGFANTAFVSVGTTITGTLGNNLVHMAAGDLIEGQPYELFTNFNPAGLFTSMGGAVAGYFASQLAGEIVMPDSALSSSLGSIGSSIGGFLGSVVLASRRSEPHLVARLEPATAGNALAARPSSAERRSRTRKRIRATGSCRIRRADIHAVRRRRRLQTACAPGGSARPRDTSRAHWKKRTL